MRTFLRLGLAVVSSSVLALACSSGSTGGTGGGTSSSTSASSGASTSTSASSSAAASSSAGGAAASSSSSGAGGSGGAAAFTLTSMVLTEGGMFPKKYACGGMNVSPDLEWAGAPSAAKSFAVVMTDKSNMLIHWAIWDISPSAMGLPEAVATTKNPANVAGANQVLSYDGQTYGYLGPCPPSLHTYELVVYAVDTATLPGVTTSSTRDEVEAAVKQHVAGSASLSAQADKQN